MKIVQGIQMKVSVENKEDFVAYVAGQLAVKDATGFHSAVFDEKEKKATIIYLNDSNKENIVRGQKIVEVYVD